MCGHDWCSVRISKEIVEFASGKAEGYERGQPQQSAALTEEQRSILAQRGVLSPDEIHRLASKTRKAVGAEDGQKASCHSDFAEAPQARGIQQERLVELRTGPKGSSVRP